MMEEEEEESHTAYLKKHLVRGTKVVSLRKYRILPEGTVGEFVESGRAFPPVHVNWLGEDFQGSYWVYLRDIALLSDFQQRRVPRPISEYKSLADFKDELSYANYLVSVLEQGIQVRCVEAYGPVLLRDTGEYLACNDGTPSCQVYWDTLGTIAWVPFRCLEIGEGKTEDWESIVPDTSPPWKMPQDFQNLVMYTSYLKATLRAGMKVKMMNSFEAVLEGDIGVFKQWTDSVPSVEVDWMGLDNSTYWVFFKDIVIVEGTSSSLSSKSCREPLVIAARRSQDFDSEVEYAIYLKSVLRPGMDVSIEKDSEHLKVGEVCTFRQYNHGWPPCQVYSERLDALVWVFWNDISIHLDKEEQLVPGPPWKSSSDFAVSADYCEYLKCSLKLGMKISCVQSCGYVLQGDVGKFISWTFPDLIEADWENASARIQIPYQYIVIVESTDLASIESVECLPGPPWQVPSDFGTELAYSLYLKTMLQPGMLLKLLRQIGNHKAGSSAYFVGFSGEELPLEVSLNGHCSLASWKDIEIIEGLSSPSESCAFDCGPPWKPPSDFSSPELYVSYLEKYLKHGLEVKCIESFESVMQGDIGEFIQRRTAFPSCQIRWKGLGDTFWIPFKCIQIVEGMTLDLCDTVFEEKIESWCHATDFPDENSYALYLKRNLQFAMKVRSVSGDEGVFICHNTASPPCLILWQSTLEPSWVFWRDFRIHSDAPASLLPKAEFTKPRFYVDYLRSHLEFGTLVECTKSFPTVLQGDVGFFVRLMERDQALVYWRTLEKWLASPLEHLSGISCLPEAQDFQNVSRILESGDFANENDYAEYLKKKLTPGLRVQAIHAFEEVPAGAYGSYVLYNSGWPPVKVLWEHSQKAYWVFWSNIRIAASPSTNLDDLLWKRLTHFSSEDAYAVYLQSTLRPGMLVKLINSYESVMSGDVGEFITYNSGTPPCQVRWHGLEGPYWVHWRDIVIVDGTPESEMETVEAAPGPPWKGQEDFSNDNLYASYLKQLLQPGMKIKCIRTYESINEGDVGYFVQYNRAWPPCQIRWQGLGNVFWVFWRDIRIVEGVEDHLFRPSLSSEIGPPWKTLLDFENEEDYVSYFKRVAKPSMKIKCVTSYESVLEGDVGDLISWRGEYPPLRAFWNGIKHDSYVDFRNAVIVEGTEDATPEMIEALPGPPWMTFAEARSESVYFSYLRQVLQPGMRIHVTKSFERIRSATRGIFQRFQDGALQIVMELDNGESCAIPSRLTRVIEGLEESEIKKFLFLSPSPSPSPTRSPVSFLSSDSEPDNSLELFMQWKFPFEFSSGWDYIQYLKTNLKPGFLVLSLRSYHMIKPGDIGEFVTFNDGYPPCQVSWKRTGNKFWVYFKDLVIVQGCSDRVDLILKKFRDEETLKHRHWKCFSDFETVPKYFNYLKSKLTQGMLISALDDFDRVLATDIGEFQRWDPGHVPVFAFWKTLGAACSVPISVVQIYDNDEDDSKDVMTCAPAGSLWRRLVDCRNLVEYIRYLKKVLRPGMKIRCSQSYESVCQGDIGEFTQFNEGVPPCQALWTALGTTYWIPWHLVEIVEGSKESYLPIPEASPLIPGKPCKILSDFKSEAEYSMYMKQILGPGMRLRAIHDYEKARAGEIGEFIQWNKKWPPCEVNWSGATRQWMFWRDVELIPLPVEWSTKSSFSKLNDYYEYMIHSLKEGMMVQALVSFEAVSEGDIGQVSNLDLNAMHCSVTWKGLKARTDNVDLSQIEIVEGTSRSVYILSDAASLPSSLLDVSHFESENAYADYMKTILTPGQRLEVVSDRDVISFGSIVEFVGAGTIGKPCIVRLVGSSDVYQVFWRSVKLYCPENLDSKSKTTCRDWMSILEFSDDVAYVEYLKTVIENGLSVKAIASDGHVLEGDIGVFLHWNGDVCLIDWKGMGQKAPISPKCIQIVEGTFANQLEDVSFHEDEPWRTREDFNTENGYVMYLRKALRPGFLVQSIDAFPGGIGKDEKGFFVALDPMCPNSALVEWIGLNQTLSIPLIGVRVIQYSSFRRNHLVESAKLDKVKRA